VYGDIPDIECSDSPEIMPEYTSNNRIVKKSVNNLSLGINAAEVE
jgi:hypothetical protein